MPHPLTSGAGHLDFVVRSIVGWLACGRGFVVPLVDPTVGERSGSGGDSRVGARQEYMTLQSHQAAGERDLIFWIAACSFRDSKLRPLERGIS